MSKTFTAREVLTHLYAEATWEEDVDGDIDNNGRMVNCTHHDIRISDQLLSELLDMAGIARRYETPLVALARANKEDNGLPEPPKAPEPEIIF